MTSLEDRLRALRDLEVPPAAGLPSLRRRTARRRARQFAASAAGAMLLVGAVIAWPDGSGHARVDTVDDGVPTSTSAPSTTSTTAAGGGPPSPSVIVTAGANGVTLFNGDDVSQLSTSPASAAHVVNHEIVVFQDGTSEFDEFPPTPQGPARVWMRGEIQDLPVDAEAMAARLLDARIVGAGTPMALVAETFGIGAGPDDRFEELVLINLLDLSRQVVLRRPSWESAHLSGRLLPDGDVIGLFSSEALVLMARWSLEEGDALWTTEIGSDVVPDLTLREGMIVLVDVTFEGHDFLPTVSTTTFGLSDGGERSRQLIAIPSARGELGAGLFCTGWFSLNEIACGRSDGPPVAVSVDVRRITPLPGEHGAMPAVIRAV